MDVPSDAALVIVDVQNDFCPGGALAVPTGDQIMPVINRLIEAFQRSGRPIIASRDWHPARTKHFTTDGGSWPPHCVAGTAGAAFHPSLTLPKGAVIVQKGAGAHEDAYSAFDATLPDGTPLEAILRRENVRHVVVGGLATDYCVRATVLDARQSGYEVTVVREAIRGVDVQTGDSERAIDDMRAAGAIITT
ncbi:MAG: bifunctional nicotinamidase/pyrazinamidase [Chloroflexota bacterium]|nr:MAG: bifunctional nicotinamidase/pyrazinamidase [Chloroflexota bacterium]